jgi:DNA segregation ATPase FtsK/SpoIIIE-like protein
MTDDVTARLLEITANLNAYIEARAAEIAAPRIAAAEEQAKREVADLKAQHASEIQRLEDLVGELRRQIQPLARHVEQCPETMANRAKQARNDAGADRQLLLDAAGKVIDAQRADQNWIQRHVRVGFAKAGRLLELLEDAGVIGAVPASRSGQRQVLIPKEQKDAALTRLRETLGEAD